MHHLHDAPQPLRERVPEIAPAVERVVLKALAKEPQARFPSILAFADALEQASSGKAEAIAETSSTEHLSNELLAEIPSSGRRKDPSPAGKKKAVRLVLLILIVLGALIGSNALWMTKHQPLFAPTMRISLSPATKSGSQTSPDATPTEAGPIGLCASSTNWSMLGFDAQNTKYNSDEHTLNPHTIPNLQTVWSTYTGSSLNPPVFANGILYLPTSQNINEPNNTTVQVSTLYAISCQTGKILWQTNLRLPEPQGHRYDGDQSDIYTVAVADGMVYATDGSGMLSALNARTGATGWQTRITNTNSTTYLNLAPIVVNDALYLHTSNGNIYAVDAKTGSALWNAHTDMNLTENGGVSIPAAANGVIYVGGSRYLYAFDAQKGDELWRGEVDSTVPFTPVVSQGLVYAAADNGNVFAFNASGCGVSLCGPFWHTYFGLPPSEATPNLPEIMYPPAIANGVLYVGTTANSVFGGGYLFTVNARSGAVLWKADTGDFHTGEAGTDASPVVANGVLYFINAGGKLFTFDASGCGNTTCTPFWTTSLRNNFGPGYSITVSNSSVYVNTPGGTLYALRLPGT